MKQTLSSSHPDLAAQLVDPTVGDLLTYGSAKPVEWRCPLGHVWTASPNTRTHGHGCSVCSGKTVLPGFNDLLSQDRALAAQLVDPSLARTVTPKSGAKLQWRCEHGHVWTASVGTRSRGHGCSVCTGKRVQPGQNDLARLRPDIAGMLVDPSQAEKVTMFSNRVLEWRCEHGHQWPAPVARVVGGSSCPSCSGLRAEPGETDLATKRPDLAVQLVDPSLAAVLKASSNKPTEWRCPLGHVWTATPNARTSKQATGCPVCSNRIVLTGFNDLATSHSTIAEQALDDVSSLTRGSNRPVRWRCERGHEWIATPCDRTVNHSGCPSCAASRFVSRGEGELADVVRRLLPGREVRTTVRNAIPRSELDIVVPDMGIAFEFNGLYWHSDAFPNAVHRHAHKTALAADAGLRLVHIWEDDWRDRREQVVRAVAHRLRAAHLLLDVLPEVDPRIIETRYARSLLPDCAKSTEASSFLQQNHLQGKVSLTRAFVLRDEHGATRALLGLRGPRASARMKRGPGDWDVQRYATLGSVPGGFTRLLKHAERTLLAEGAVLDRWISFSDDGISDGGMYEKAGFQASERLAPDYRYVRNSTASRRMPKESFQTRRFRERDDLLFKEGLPERELAHLNGLRRIYDAGKTRWVKAVG